MSLIKRAGRRNRRAVHVGPTSPKHALRFELLEERSVLSVTLAPITGPEPGGLFNVPSGKSLFVPLSGADPGYAVSYTASSSDPSVNISVLQSTPILEFIVHGQDVNNTPFSGALRFALLTSLAPHTVQGIIDKVNAGLYDGASFYRMETGSGFRLIQGGIERTPGKSDTVVLPDEYTVDSTFNSGGLLALANAGPNTAASEIFVTAPDQPLAQTPGILNYSYTVLGQLLHGEDIYAKILSAPTTVSSFGIHYANNPVTIDSAAIVSDEQSAVLQVTTPNDYVGATTITVVAHANDSTSASRQFNVAGVTPNTTYLWLSPVADQATTAGVPVSFQLSASKNSVVPGDVTFSVSGSSSFRQAIQHASVQVTPGAHNTATITITPDVNFAGTLDLIAHADLQPFFNFGIYDALRFRLTVAPAASIADFSVHGDSWGAGVAPFSLPTNGAVAAPVLPWTGIDQIRFSFDDDVMIEQDDLALTGDRPSYSFSKFSYNAASKTATWTLAQPLGLDHLQLELGGPTSIIGRHVYRLVIHPGDASGDDRVTGADYTLWAAAFTATPAASSPRRADFNADGIVNGADYSVWSAYYLSPVVSVQPLKQEVRAASAPSPTRGVQPHTMTTVQPASPIFTTPASSAPFNRSVARRPLPSSAALAPTAILDAIFGRIGR